MMHVVNPGLDETDISILQTLQENGSISNVRLAESIALSPAATLSRVKKLEQDGVIEGYQVKLNKDKLGFGLSCFIQVSLKQHEVDLAYHFRDAVKLMPEVIECHFVTGMSDYLLKVAVKDRAALEYFLVHTLTPVEGVERIRTSLILNEVKTHTVLPLLAEK